MKLSDLIKKHGNKEVDEQAVINMLGLKVSNKPEYGEVYWFVDDCGSVATNVWEDGYIDNFRYSQGNCFATEEAAVTYRHVLETEDKLRQYAKKHNDGVIDWDDNKTDKYFVCLETINNEPFFNWTYSNKAPRIIYFTSSEIANAAIESVGKEAVMEYLRYEW